MKLFNKLFFYRSKAGILARELESNNLVENSNSLNFWNRFKKNKTAFWSFNILLVLVILSLLAPILANDKPIYCKYKGHHLFPALSLRTIIEIKNEQDKQAELLNYDVAEWKLMKLETVYWALLSTYSPNKSDLSNSGYVSPFQQQAFKKDNGDLILTPLRFRHWMGTNIKGADVLSGLIHGIKFSLGIGFCAMFIATIIGVVLGALAGYYANSKVSIYRGILLSLIVGLFIAFFYGFITRKYILIDSMADSGLNLLFQLMLTLVIFLIVLYLFYYFGKKISKLSFFKKRLFLPVDSIISRLIEIMDSIPLFVLLIAVSSVVRPSYFNLIVILGLTSWVHIARITRAEFMRITSLEYIQAGKSLGLTETSLIFKHALPNALSPILVQIAFGIAACILTESTLSFLGIGVPPETVTWGKLLSEGRQHFTAWWMVIFPGMAIFLAITIYNLIGDGFRDALDPRLKN